jgi:AGCS family alanine or glycine:cation symporter
LPVSITEIIYILEWTLFLITLKFKGPAMDLTTIINTLMGWPVIIVAVSASILCTLVFKFIQFRYFTAAWRYFLTPSETEKTACADMSPAQALINALNSNLGNGTIAGMAVALVAGGPGAAFWLLVMGLLLMAVRFAEVFLSLYYGKEACAGSKVGGPMFYLSHVFGGSILPYLYAFSVFLYILVGANGMQVNSIALCFEKTLGIPTYIMGILFAACIIYVVMGGANRILKASEKIVPVKVGLFCLSTLAILIVKWASIIPALKLIVTSAFTPLSVAGGLLGYTVQQALATGITKIAFASEAGLGTTAIMYGATSSKSPVKDAIMSMLSAFLTTVLAFTLCLCIVATGAWDNGLTSTPLTMSAFATVFGTLGNWIVMFLALTFGLGSIVACAYTGREVWMFLTNGKLIWLFNAIYCAASLVGAIADVDVVFNLISILTIIVLTINLYGIVSLLPTIRRALTAFEQGN